jgi:hypothetical protein
MTVSHIDLLTSVVECVLKFTLMLIIFDRNLVLSALSVTLTSWCQTPSCQPWLHDVEPILSTLTLTFDPQKNKFLDSHHYYYTLFQPLVFLFWFWSKVLSLSWFYIIELYFQLRLINSSCCWVKPKTMQLACMQH